MWNKTLLRQMRPVKKWPWRVFEKGEDAVTNNTGFI